MVSRGATCVYGIIRLPTALHIYVYIYILRIYIVNELSPALSTRYLTSTNRIIRTDSHLVAFSIYNLGESEYNVVNACTLHLSNTRFIARAVLRDFNQQIGATRKIRGNKTSVFPGHEFFNNVQKHTIKNIYLIQNYTPIYIYRIYIYINILY